VGCCSSPTWGEHGLAGAASRRGRKAGSSTEASGGEPPRIVTARVGGLELWPYAGNGAWWQPRRPSHLLFLSSSADGGQLPLITGRCRRVGTRQPDKPGRTVDFELLRDVGHRSLTGRRCSRRSPPEVHAEGASASQVVSRGSTGRTRKCPPMTLPPWVAFDCYWMARRVSQAATPIVAWTKRPPAPKARSGRFATCAVPYRRRWSSLWRFP
jgi:hypothetical protein